MTRARSSQKSTEKEMKMFDWRVLSGTRRHRMMSNARLKYPGLD